MKNLFKILTPILILVLVLFTSKLISLTPVSAATTMKFLINGADDDGPGAAATYNFIASADKSTWNTIQTNRDTPVAAAMTLTDMVVRISTAPDNGAGTQSRTFKVFKNGSATAIAVTISETNVQATITGQSVSFAAGDTISMESTSANSPIATTDVYWSIVAESVSTAYFVLFGGSASAINTTSYQNLQNGVGLWESAATSVAQVMPLAGNMTILYTDSTVAPGTDIDAWDVAVMVDEVASALSVHYAATETGIKSGTGTVAVTAGQTVALEALETGTNLSTAMAWSAVVEPTTAGQSAIMFGNPNPPLATGAAEFEQLFGAGGNSWVTPESARYASLFATTIQALYFKVGTAPGGSTTWTVQMREEVSDLAGVANTITGAATTGNTTGLSVAVTTGNRYNWSMTPSATDPTAMTGGAHIGLQVFFTPTTDAVVIADVVIFKGDVIFKNEVIFK